MNSLVVGGDVYPSGAPAMAHTLGDSGLIQTGNQVFFLSLGEKDGKIILARILLAGDRRGLGKGEFVSRSIFARLSPQDGGHRRAAAAAQQAETQCRRGQKLFFRGFHPRLRPSDPQLLPGKGTGVRLRPIRGEHGEVHVRCTGGNIKRGGGHPLACVAADVLGPLGA